MRVISGVTCGDEYDDAVSLSYFNRTDRIVVGVGEDTAPVAVDIELAELEAAVRDVPDLACQPAIAADEGAPAAGPAADEASSSSQAAGEDAPSAPPAEESSPAEAAAPTKAAAPAATEAPAAEAPATEEASS